jgi:hypothetical protein
MGSMNTRALIGHNEGNFTSISNNVFTGLIKKFMERNFLQSMRLNF